MGINYALPPSIIKTFDQGIVECLVPYSSQTGSRVPGPAQHGGRLGAVCNQGSLWGFWRASANSIAALYPYVEFIGRFTDEHIILLIRPENAVDPMNFEPNLALDLEISDLINSKKGGAYDTRSCYKPFELTLAQASRSRRRDRQLHQQSQPQCLPPRPHCTTI